MNAWHGILIGAWLVGLIACLTLLAWPTTPRWEGPPSTVTEDDDDLIDYATWFVFEALDGSES